MSATPDSVDTPESAAELYAALRAGSTHPMSISRGVEVLRLLPAASMFSDRQLGDLVAAAAVRHGISVNFDQNYIDREIASAKLGLDSW